GEWKDENPSIPPFFFKIAHHLHSLDDNVHRAVRIQTKLPLTIFVVLSLFNLLIEYISSATDFLKTPLFIWNNAYSIILSYSRTVFLY
ncbi:hypothetical protein C6A37_10450, partial [Desulfobacteraceae bacterium SEEP-SAG9]